MRLRIAKVFPLSLPAKYPKKMLLGLIGFYRKYLSALKMQPTCRFYPTCSQYAIEAIEIHGVLKGTILAVLRLLRCNPLFPGGYDPVP